MQENNLPSNQAVFYFTPVLINMGAELVLLDTGPGGDKCQVAARMADAGYTTDQVDTVVLTHFHPDHVCGLMKA